MNNFLFSLSFINNPLRQNCNNTKNTLSKHWFSLLHAKLCIFLLAVYLFNLTSAQAENAPADPFLLSDGTLNKKALSGHNLSLDIKGWHITLDPKKGPVFNPAPPPSGTWSALDKGLNNNVYSVAVLGTDVYVGGEFTDVGSGGTPVAGLNNVAKWNGTTWSALDKGLNDGIFSLTVLGTDIYVGGLFTDIGTGGTPVEGLNRVAKWNGTAWSALDKGLNNSVSWIEKQGTDLYMAGDFTEVGLGGTPVAGLNRVAKWNGTTWSALDKGLNDGAYALAVSGGDVYVGGGFTNVGSGGTSVSGLNYIAKWNGTTWSALNGGFNGSVFAIAVKGTDVYAGGTFTIGGGNNLNHIGKWDGTTWSALENGVNGDVTCVSVIGSDIYVGGYFTNTGFGGTPTPNLNMIAKWDGTAWSTLDYGLNFYVWAIVPIANDLYVGGQFLGIPAGGTYVAGLNAMAKWTLPQTCVEPIVYNVTGGGTYCAGGVGLDIGLSNSEIGVSYQLLKDGIEVGALKLGTGSPLNFGKQTAEGTYSMVGKNNISACSTNMANDVSIIITPANTPSVYIASNSSVLEICAGTSITLAAIPEYEGTTPTYQWRKNGMDIIGAAAPTFTITSSTFANGDNISVVMTSNASCITTATAISPLTTIIIKAAPTVTAVPNQTVSAGSNTAAVTFTGTGATTYTWTNNNTATGLAASGVGNIATFTATNSTSAVISSTVTVTPVSGIGYAYVTNNGSNSVSVINTGTNAVVATVAVGAGPQGVSVSPDGSRVYITNFSSNSVSVINTSTNTVVATIGVGSSPTGVVVSPDGSRVYVANRYSDNVTVINTSTNTVEATVGVGTNPGGVVVSPDGSRLYVTNRGSNTVSVINTSTNTVVGTVSVGTYPLGIVISPNGSRLYVTSRDANNVSVINTSTNSVDATIAVGSEPICLSISPDASRVYVSNSASNTVSVINTSTNAVVTTVSVGSFPSGVSFNPDGSHVYIANFNSNTVSVINTNTNTVVATVAVGDSPVAFGNFIKTGTTGCTGTPTTFILTVNAIPSVSIAITAGAQTICPNTSVTFTATPTNGGTPTYVWRKNGTPIGGQTNATYTTTDLVHNDVITCVMTSSLATVSSATATSAGISMTVNPMLTPSVSIASNTTGAICAGSSIIFTATPQNGGASTYQWRKNGTNIGGETGYDFTSSTLANGDIISVVMTSTADCITVPTTISTGITLSIKSLPTVNTVTNQTVCDGVTTTPVTFSGTATRYDWTNSLSSIGLTTTGSGNISGFSGTNSTLIPVNSAILVTPIYTNGGLTCTGVPNSFSIIVNPRPTPITVNSAQNNICSGAPTTLSYTGGANSSTVFSESFNADLTNWTRTNNSTGGAVENAAWTQRPSGYTYGEIFNTPDLSGFYMSNSDAQGSGTTTNTITTTQSFSTIGFTNMSISLSHYYRSYYGQTGKVQLSKDGSTWADINVFTDERGTSDDFVTDNFTVPSTFENQAAVYLRFQFISYFGWYWAINDVAIAGTQTRPSSLVWSATPAGFTSTVANPTANPTVNTNYKVAVTNLQGCTRTGAIDVTVKAVPIFTTVQTNILCNGGGAKGVIEVTANVGTAPFYFSKDDGMTYTASTASPYSFTNLPVGTYKIKIKDAFGCESIAKDAAITEPTPLSIDARPNVIFCSGSETTINVTASGGSTTASKPYQYSLNGGAYQASSSFTVRAGTYTITAKDANDCSKSTSPFEILDGVPLIQCPQPIRIECGQLTQDGKALPSLTGQLQVTGFCLTTNQITYTDTEYNLDCGTLVSASDGSTTLPFNPNFAIDAKKVLLRRFAVNSASVVSYACYQSIFIVPNKLADIVFPDNITLTCANTRTAPSDTTVNHYLVKGAGEPTLNSQTLGRTFCDNFKTTFTDVPTTTTTGLTIQRTWVIKADCGTNSRTKVQIITVPNCTVSNISGAINRENGTEIPTATQLINMETGTKITETGVNFAFRNIAINSRLQVKPTRPNTDWTSGVTMLDVSILTKHLQDIVPITSPYNLISADANADGSLDATDMLLMQRLILRLIPALPNNNSWRFIVKKFAFLQPENPFAADFPEILSIPNLTEAISNADFVAIKVADINQSAGSVNIRSGAMPFNLLVEDKVLEKGKTYIIPIEMTLKIGKNVGEVSNLPDVSAVQFTLNVDKTSASIEGIKTGNLANFTDNNVGLFAKEGIITAAWQRKNGSYQNETDKLTMMTITLKPTSNTRLSDILSVNSLYTEGVAYDTKGVGLPVNLSFSNQKSINEKAVLLPNRPNPFSDETTIAFTLPEAGKAKLTVCDLLGKVVMSTEKMFNKGLNEVVFDATSTPSVSNGIFVVRLQTATGVLEQKIVMSR